ncbi:MAG: tetratricopeptide repeat protein, partial [Caldilinea sp.]|nr:tetratricopeptide repeat protein [Caldilinea sp.]MDW8442617.1 tetratricopeptide repeat protein [Caldilineaceae bacterium]
AAHWVRHYSVAELAAALSCAAPTFFSTHKQDLPARHRSMEGILDTSWRLLSPEAQQVLAELSVFRGAFSRKAALAVTQSSIERLYELVNQSLLHVVEHSSGRKSYMMHELVRQFAATKLAAPDARQPGTAATICRRHSDYYLNFASERVNDLYGRAMRLAAEDMQAEMDNVRAAWEWALQECSAATIASAIAGLQAFYHVRSLYQEGEALFRKAAAILSATDVPSGEIAGAVLELHLARAFFLNLLHRYEDAAAVAHQALLACEGQNLVVLAITAQVERGVALSLQGMHDAALPQLKEAVQAAHSLKLTGLEARALHALFRCLLPAGEIERANSVLMQALNLYHQTENRLSEGFVLRSLGYVAHFQGEEEKALDFWEQALQIYQELGDRPRLLSIWQHLGDAYAALGDLGRAYEYYVTAYARREEVYDPRHAAHTEDGFARLLIRLGRYAQAHELSRQALAEQRRLGDRIGVIETLYTLGVAEREMGDAPAALLHYQEALHLSRTSNAQFYEGAILFEIGNAWAALERPGMALAAYHQALDLTHADGRLHLRIAVKGEMAAVYLAQGHLTEALALIEEALPLLNVSILQKLRDPLRVYWICCQVLQANRVAGADSLLAEAYAYLQMEANSLHDETLRTSLLERVFVNRMIQKAYRSGF